MYNSCQHPKKIFIYLASVKKLLIDSWSINEQQPGLGLVRICCWEFEIGPIHIPTFQEKVTHSYTNRSDFGWNFDQSYPIFFRFSYIFEPILAQFLEKKIEN